jgi:2-keto-4-pentenoate hydratase/2-oxohepta-3-ene-1,7-dioic acid hydratase in catechol pathway
MVEFLKRGDGAMDAARRAVARYEAERPASIATPLASCDLLSPVPRPGKILMGGRNYLRHLDELRKEGASRGEKIITPPMPHIFAKYHNSVTGHGKPIIYPGSSSNSISRVS